MKRRFYHTSQFARKASISVRTLRYYDKVGLFSPSGHTETGYRLYSDEDLPRLQQILALKFLGLSLEEIKRCLHPPHAGGPTEPRQLRELLAQQKAMMHEKRAHLDAIITAIEEAERLLQSSACDWDALINVIQAIQAEQHNKDWVKKYFSAEQLKIMAELSEKSYTAEAAQKLKMYHPGVWTEADQLRVNAQYARLASELRHLVASGADPGSAEAQAAAHLCVELCSGFSRNDPAIKASVKTWWEHLYALPPEQRPLQLPYGEAEAAFLQQAMKIYHMSAASDGAGSSG